MADQLQFRGGTTAQVSAASVASREIIIDTDTEQIAVGPSKKKTVMEDSSGRVDIPGTLDVTGAATFDSTASFPLGTAALPSLYPGSDVDTGLYSPGANQLAISTNGTGRLAIGSSGNVSIGTTANTNKLRVHEGSDNANIFIVTGADETSEFLSLGINSGVPTVTAGGVGSTSSELAFRTADSGTETERLRIDSSGNVGIGESSPANLLHVKASDTGITPHPSAQIVLERSGTNYLQLLTASTGTQGILFGDAYDNDRGKVVYDHSNDSMRFEVAAGERMRIDSSGSITAAGNVRVKGAGLTVSETYSSGNDVYKIYDNSGQFAIESQKYGNTTTNSAPIVFRTSSSDGRNERMRIGSSGNVGIGTTSPASILHVEIPSGAAYIRSHSTSNSVKSFFGASNGGVDIGSESNNVFRFYTNNGERMRIDSSGNVGIGTTSPDARCVVYRPTQFAGNPVFSVKTDAGSTQSAKFLVDGNGNVGIGTTAPEVNLHVFKGESSGAGANAQSSLILENSSNTYLQFLTPTANEAGILFGDSDNDRGGITYSHADDTLNFRVAASLRATIDSSGRLLVGTSTSIGTFNSSLQVAGSGNASTGLLARYDNTDSGPFFHLVKSRSGTVGANTLVQNGDELGTINFAGADGSAYLSGARIAALIDGAASAGDLPTRLVFSTTASGSASPTERMRIDSSGNALIGTTNTNPSGNNVTGVAISSGGRISASVSEDAHRFGRAQDGDVLQFQSAGGIEGSISISGSTTSYNGAHLSRWSQLRGGAERTEILRGSVLSNLDEMCEWGEEDNEQLNRMQVSDVEGDKNVSGVFQTWDDDDDTYVNDFYCAMTGDFVIRIAQGTTVARGDLLMSAGDGTAKPQDDDIIRSKTIAKVTSTNVSETYADGSYCVPCVLMAC